MLIDYAVPKLKKYPTAAAVDHALLELTAKSAGVAPEELESDVDVVSAIEVMGLWGFMDTNDCTLHYWWNGADDARLLEFFAHELGHLVSTRTIKPLHKQRGAPRDEITADLFAWVAVTANDIARRVREEA